MDKQYGLIDPKKYKVKPNLPAPKPSIFDSDSDSDNSRPPSVAKPKQQIPLRHKDRVVQEKALSEDPTVYQYDEIYDDMVNERKESKLARKDIDKKPKYIGKLLQTAEKRKRENEWRIERQIQKERDAEGDEFKDKEAFVTSAYKKKLEELKELEEQEKREEYLEAIGDVTKQQDLGGFYRHLYEQKIKDDDDNKSKKTKEIVKEENEIDSIEPVDETKETDSMEPVDKTENRKQFAQKRAYRKRLSKSESENEENDEGKSKEKVSHLPSNLDADSDFSIDSDSESENDSTKKPTLETDIEIKEEPIDKAAENGEEKEKTLKPRIDDKPLEFEPAEPLETVKEEPVEKKPKIDIWKKRTVGPVFDAALEKYYKRKAARMGHG